MSVVRGPFKICKRGARKNVWDAWVSSRDKVSPSQGGDKSFVSLSLVPSGIPVRSTHPLYPEVLWSCLTHVSLRERWRG